MIGRGNEHESRKVIPLMEQVSIRGGRGGRPRKRPSRVHADKNYDTFLVRLYLHRRRVHANIPRRGKKIRPGRPAIFDKEALKKTRYSVERFFS